jgi:hypothetical protein
MRWTTLADPEGKAFRNAGHRRQNGKWPAARGGEPSGESEARGGRQRDSAG